jgi:DNA adenine methylase
MAEPFLRWAGGKRWLARALAPLIQNRLGNATYHEPFLGSGAMFFAVEPQRAVLSDINSELINAYQQVRASPAKMKSLLSQARATKTEYLRIRSFNPERADERAGRFLFLNRNCWGGLYRENKQGGFNVPYGGGDRTHAVLTGGTILEDASRLMRRNTVRLQVADFETSLAVAKSGDIVYCDPTYRKRTRQHFDRYGANIFGWVDQERLAQAARAAMTRGVLVIISNASCFGVAQLYPDALILETFRRKGIGAGGPPAALSEYVFVLDPTSNHHHWEAVGKTVCRPPAISRIPRQQVAQSATSK